MMNILYLSIKILLENLNTIKEDNYLKKLKKNMELKSLWVMMKINLQSHHQKMRTRKQN